jgi:hypothetical protein
MERLGLLSELSEIHEPIERLIFFDTNGHQQVSVPYVVLRRRLFRDRHFNFMRASLERFLRRKLTTSSIRFGTTVDPISRTIVASPFSSTMEPLIWWTY